jgi:hypothetical protein
MQAISYPRKGPPFDERVATILHCLGSGKAVEIVGIRLNARVISHTLELELKRAPVRFLQDFSKTIDNQFTGRYIVLGHGHSDS